jgi:hypothetical protein
MERNFGRKKLGGNFRRENLGANFFGKSTFIINTSDEIKMEI